MSCHCDQPAVASSFLSKNISTWCTNCGNYGIFAAVRRALATENIQPCQSLLCFDVGCNGNGSDKIGGYRFHGLHGRVLPFACGATVANQNIKVVAFGGDGGTFAEGVGHLVSAVRGNYNVMFVFHNNLNYGLTQGQASPMTHSDMKMNSSPDGPTSSAMHAIRFVMSLNPSFVARTFSGNVKHMTEIFKLGLRHKGFSFIEVLQSCPTYNKATPHEWYMEHIYDVGNIEGYNMHDANWARQVAEDMNDRLAIGMIYKNDTIMDFMDRVENRQAARTELVAEVRPYPIDDLLMSFK
jgi:2-oxoglutarate ferredoxin oxidoreductase subunit beta